MSFIFAPRVAIPFDPMSRVPKPFCGWEPWGPHLRDPKGKGPPGELQRQETLTAPQGPAVTAEPGWSAVTALLPSPVPPLRGNFSLLAVIARALPHTAVQIPHRPACAIALTRPAWTTALEPHSQCLRALGHNDNTEQKQKVNWTKGELWLLCWPRLLPHCQFVPSTCFLLCVLLGRNSAFTMWSLQFLNKWIKN